MIPLNLISPNFGGSWQNETNKILYNGGIKRTPKTSKDPYLQINAPELEYFALAGVGCYNVNGVIMGNPCHGVS